MEEPKFTKGEWHLPHIFVDEHPCKCKSILSENLLGSICQISISENDELENGCNPLFEEAKANAHLISAAPEMYGILEELEKIIEYMGEYEVPLGFQDRVKAALKKARGEA